MHITEVKSEERRGKRGVMGTGRLVVLRSMGFTRHLQVKATQGGATQSSTFSLIWLPKDLWGPT